VKLLLDEGVPWRAAGLLRDQLIEAVHVFDLKMRGASDTAILAAAIERGAAVVTLDSDFHQLLARDAAFQPSVIRFRVEGLSYQDIADWTNRVIRTVGEDLSRGVAVSVTEKAIRVHRLPLGTPPA